VLVEASRSVATRPTTERIVFEMMPLMIHTLSFALVRTPTDGGICIGMSSSSRAYRPIPAPVRSGIGSTTACRRA
jgi:hypothetical protein